MKNPDELYRKPLEAAFQNALVYLNHLDRSPVAASAGLQALREKLRKPLPDQGMPPEQVVGELIRDVEGGILASAGGRFFAWVIGGSLPSALAADWLTAAWDQNASLFATSPASAVVKKLRAHG